jgi:hypothetical protein
MSYSSVGVFTPKSVNTIMDLILFHVQNFCTAQDPVIVLNDVFVLSGKAAFLLQDETTEAIKNVILITDSVAVFQFVTFQLQNRIPQKGVVKFKNRVLFYFPEFYLEIWFTETELNVRDMGDGIKLQLNDDIPTETL